jgi:hypothetical protein
MDFEKLQKAKQVAEISDQIILAQSHLDSLKEQLAALKVKDSDKQDLIDLYYQVKALMT